MKKTTTIQDKRRQQDDAVLISRATIIELLKTLEGLKRKLQLFLKT